MLLVGMGWPCPSHQQEGSSGTWAPRLGLGSPSQQATPAPKAAWHEHKVDGDGKLWQWVGSGEVPSGLTSRDLGLGALQSTPYLVF